MPLIVLLLLQTFGEEWSTAYGMFQGITLITTMLSFHLSIIIVKASHHTHTIKTPVKMLENKNQNLTHLKKNIFMFDMIRIVHIIREKGSN